MKYLINNKDSNHLVLLLHGSETGIDSYLFKEMFEGMKDINANVAMLEFSFIENGAQADLDQVVESNEVKEFLTTQNYEWLTVIGHSNGGFVGLVATTRDIKIDHLILLGLSVRNDTTRSAEGKIIQNFLNQKRKVSVIQPEQDEYASPNEVEKLKKENSLDIDVHKIQGNHYFEGFEEQLVNVLRKCI